MNPVNPLLDNHERRISNSLYESIDSLENHTKPQANTIGRIGESSTLCHPPFQHPFVSFNL